VIAFALLAASLFTAEQGDVRDGNRLYGEGKFDEALAAYESAEKAQPSPEISLDRGDALYKLGRFDEAAEAFARALNQPEQGFQAKALYNAGTAKARGGDREGAIEALTRALELDPEDRDAKWNLEMLLRKPPEQQQKDKDKKGGDEDKDQKKEDKEKQDKEKQEKEKQEQQEKENKEKEEKAEQEKRKEEQQQQGEPQKPEPQQEKEKQEQPAQGSPKDVDKQAAERILDALKANEKNFQMWRFQLKEQKRSDAEKDW
jgi:tetratricopeptide (TPR) repeat protein